MYITHKDLPAFYDENSKILILGTIPSPKSREAGFYYMHPQNRFWNVLSHVFSCEIPNTIEGKKAFLKEHHIALWDVLESCEIEGAHDETIRDFKTNDIKKLLACSSITHIVTTGKKAYQLYQKHCAMKTGINAISLPSTSPANASFTLEKLILEYEILKDLL